MKTSAALTVERMMKLARISRPISMVSDDQTGLSDGIWRLMVHSFHGQGRSTALRPGSTQVPIEDAPGASSGSVSSVSHMIYAVWAVLSFP